MPVLEDVYPSRKGTEARIVDRKDPVVFSDSQPEKGLNAEQAEAYKRDGFLSIESLFKPEEVKTFTNELRRLGASREMKERDETIYEPDSGTIRSIFRVHKFSDIFDKLSRDERILNIVRYILNDDVYLHQARINFKPGFRGKEFYWHSDFETWHVEDGMPRMRCLSLSLALTENFEFNGPLMLIPGSQNKFVECVGETPANHHKESLRKQEYGVPDNESLTKLVDEHGISVPKGPAGSATFFDCNTIHGSNGNITPYPRSNVFFVYNAVSNKLEVPFCGLSPRPENIAQRESFDPLEPVAPNYPALA